MMIFKYSTEYFVRLKTTKQRCLCVECHKLIPQGVRAYRFSVIGERKILSIFSAVWMCLSCGDDWGTLGYEMVLTTGITPEEFAEHAQIGFLKDQVFNAFKKGVLKTDHFLVQDWVDLSQPRLTEADGQPPLLF